MSHLKFAYEALNRTASNQITLNWTVQSQTEACSAKLSCDICTIMRYYAALISKFLTDISGEPIGSIFRGQEIQKREHSMAECN